MIEPISFADGFRQVDRGEWHELVARALSKGRGHVEPQEVERILATPTDDGHAVQPLYTAEDVAAVPLGSDPGSGDRVRGSRPADGSGWSIIERVWLRESESAEVGRCLDGGADGVWLTGSDPARFVAALSDLDPEKTPVILEGFRRGAEVAEAFLSFLDGRTAAPGSSLGLDPVGQLAATGRVGDVDRAAELAALAGTAGLTAFAIDASIYHEAGASFAEEIACGTAAAVATLRRLSAGGMDIADAARLIEFRWAVTDDQFSSIAKLRAARIVWARVLEVAGAGEDRGQGQHAVTSAAMLTARDPWVNLIRNCVAAFAAGVGGADRVTVLPHTLALGEVDDFAERMARNTQHLLLGESHVGFVADPAGGSFAVESRTTLLAEAAWSFLRDIEGAGGMRSALEAGIVDGQISRTWNRRAAHTASRLAPITGVSEFPDRERAAGGLGEPWHRPGGGLPQHRFSEAFEGLRDRADAAAQPPVVALVTLGQRAAHAAREGFAANLFAAGGIDTVSVPFEAGSDLDLPSPAVVVCLCGSEAEYAGSAAPAAAAASKAGASRIWVAGRPGERADSDAAAGIDGHLYTGCDVVAVLEQTLSDLGVQ